jgi:hypothetical protein
VVSEAVLDDEPDDEAGDAPTTEEKNWVKLLPAEPSPAELVEQLAWEAAAM